MEDMEVVSEAMEVPMDHLTAATAQVCQAEWQEICH